MKLAAILAGTLLGSVLSQDSSNIAPPALTPGGSGALVIRDGTIDIVPSVVPRLPSYNEWRGSNAFIYLRLVPSSGQPMICDGNRNSLGQLWFDNSEPNSTHLRMCGISNGIPGWMLVR